MIKLLFRKWWLILLQGVVLIIMSIYIFNHPDEVLAGLSIWFGLLLLLSGILGAVSWVSADPEEKESIDILWNLITLLFGLIILFHLLTAMKVFVVVFGTWIVLTGLRLAAAGWKFKKNYAFGWVVLVAGILSVAAGISMIFDTGSGARGISVLFGVQVLLTGIALVLLSFVKKALMEKVSNQLSSTRAKINNAQAADN